MLGSGGARGMAHIGVIEELEKDGYEIVSVVGCSMGAVIGAMYCSGHLPIYRDWLLTLTRNRVFRLLDFTLPSKGLVRGEKVLGKMQEFTGNRLIEDLPVPFVAVATDILKGEEVYFRKGDMYEALRASISIPGVFTPLVQGQKLLVDGGVLNPLPLNVPPLDEDVLTVAVSLNGHDEEMMKEVQKLSLVDLVANSYEFTQDRLVDLTIQMYQPDMVVHIPRLSCHIYDFHKAASMIEIGKERYQEAQSLYQENLKKRRKIRFF